MAFRALIYTHEQSVARDLVQSVASLPIEWFLAACPEQTSVMIGQGSFDLVLIDCDSLVGRELFAQAQNSRFSRIFALFGVCTDPASVPDGVTVQKPIDQAALSRQLRHALPMFS
jgi:hypothetical protein